MLATAKRAEQSRSPVSPPPRCAATQASRKWSGAPPRSSSTISSSRPSGRRPTKSASVSSSCGGQASGAETGTRRRRRRTRRRLRRATASADPDAWARRTGLLESWHLRHDETVHYESAASVAPVPIYEYRCPNGHVFEVFQRMDDPPPEVVRDLRRRAGRARPSTRSPSTSRARASTRPTTAARASRRSVGATGHVEKPAKNDGRDDEVEAGEGPAVSATLTQPAPKSRAGRRRLRRRRRGTSGSRCGSPPPDA